MSRRPPLAFLAFIMLTSPGCLLMLLGNTQASQEELKPYYFTYAGKDPYSDRSQGLVLGRIATGKEGGLVGTTFRIQRETGGSWTTVKLPFDFKTSSYHGIILGRWWHDHHKDVEDVYAGNAPMGRREPVAEIIDTGGMATSLVMADSDWSRNVTALETWLPPGWFLVRLPPGRYRITDMVHHTNRTNVKQGYDTTTVASTDWTLDRKDGPVFEVAAGKTSFIGAYTYGQTGDPAVTRNIEEARGVLRQALSRLELKSTGFLLVDVPTDVSVSAPAVVPAAVKPTLAPSIPAVAGGPWRVGDPIMVEWKGSWWKATVLQIRDGSYFIHYDGWAASWDEWVPATRTRAR